MQTLNKLNPEQHATAAADRSTLVLVGAGSGKTQVLRLITMLNYAHYEKRLFDERFDARLNRQR